MEENPKCWMSSCHSHCVYYIKVSFYAPGEGVTMMINTWSCKNHERFIPSIDVYEVKLQQGNHLINKIPGGKNNIPHVT